MNPSQSTGSSTRKGKGRRQGPPPTPERPAAAEAMMVEGFPAADAGCELCSEQIVLMGLPYRIVLRCSHSTADRD